MRILALVFSFIMPLFAFSQIKPVRFCGEAGYIPFIMKTSAGEWKGYEIELAKQFAQSIYRPIEFIDLNFAGLIPGLMSARNCDFVASGMLITAERQKSVLFSLPTYKSSAAALVNIKNENKFIRFKDINKKNIKIALQNGSAEILYAQKNIPLTQKFIFDNNKDPVNAVITGRADLYIEDEAILAVAAARQKSKVIMLPASILPKNEPIDIGFGFRKDDAALRDQFNLFLKDLEKKGQLKKLQEDYFKNMIWLKDFPNN